MRLLYHFGYDKIRLSYSYNLNFPMFDRTVFFRLVASRKATPFGGGQDWNAICEENRESGSMQTARPGRNAKRFDQGTRSLSGTEQKKTMRKLSYNPLVLLKHIKNGKLSKSRLAKEISDR